MPPDGRTLQTARLMEDAAVDLPEPPERPVAGLRDDKSI
jgi:hypothetical protein